MKIRIYHQLCEEAKYIREEVFMKEQEFENEFDDIDAISTHIVLFLDNKPVATCRIFPYKDKEYHLGRVAVLKEYRAKHLGNILLKEAEKCVLLQGGEIISLRAQCRVESFYAKNGYISEGEIYLDEHCEHIDMKKVLKKKQKPLIAITTRTLHNEQKNRYVTQTSYTDALSLCNANYISVTPTKEHDYSYLVEMCDGLLVSGGGDMDPSFYHETPHEKSDLIYTLTDEMDLALIDAFYKAKKPILGICRGFQVINVYFGGTLYQDLPSQYTSDLIHSQKEDREIGTHTVTLCKDCFLGKKGETYSVNSFHHQGVKTHSNNVDIVALSEDGLVEAFENDYVMAVQWHPECMMQDAFHNHILQTFVNKCKKSTN